MTHMFDKFDKNSINDAPQNTCVYWDCPSECPLYNMNIENSSLLFNAKHEVLGVKADAGMPFVIKFGLVGDEDDIDLLLENNSLYTLEIFNNKRVKVAECFSVYDDEEKELSFSINGETLASLPYGFYYMKVSTVLEDETYVLFSERDGILNIE